ncbi:MAG: hypothetical protein GY865_18665 [candidate division Zixibacteria bacterium]|nr:hypothetical protein [candidate division Zixibacteria bacterium]
MKMAKIFTVLLTLVLAVFCLNGQFAFGEHPWDETTIVDGGDGGDLDGTNPSDPDDGTDSPNKAGSVSPEAHPDDMFILDLIEFTLRTSIFM